MQLELNKVQKIILIFIILTSAVSWLVLSRQSDADNNNIMMRAMMLYDPISISLFTATWTVGMAAMMFPSITPMVLLYDRLIRASGDGRDNTKDDMSHALVVEWDESPRRNLPLPIFHTFLNIVFVGSYLAIWAITGIALLLAWSILMTMTLLTKLIEAGVKILDKRTTENKKDAIFDEIVGYSDIKKEFARALDASSPVGILLCGPPGCGKSEFLKQIRNHCEKESVFIDGSYGSKAGIFQILYDKRPKYVLLDEIDKLSSPDQRKIILIII